MNKIGKFKVGDRVAFVDAEAMPYIEIFSWRIREGKHTQYAVADAPRYLGGKRIQMHELIMYGVFGHRQTERVIDHIDGNGLNNLRSNLRFATESQNHANQRKTRGTSKFKGVYLNKKWPAWHAQICVDKKRIYLGRHKTEGDAARAYDDAAIKLFGEFAKLNFPSEVRK